MEGGSPPRIPFVAVLLLALILSGCFIFPDNVQVDAPEVAYIAVATGNYHMCGLTDAGEVYCWTNQDPRPIRVSDEIPFAQISTFDNHTCGVSTSGEAYCWGLNTFGQLGTEATTQRCVYPGTRAIVTCSTDPVPVASDLLFQSVAVGAGHTCGLATDGSVQCWGLNARGQLGTSVELECDTESFFGAQACTFEPLPVDGELVFASISAGQQHTCGVTEDGTAYCWGAGDAGRLGNGTFDDSAVPTSVGGGLEFSSISAGGGHTCGVDRSGIAYCWGANSGLQLGVLVNEPGCGGPITPCASTPQQVSTVLHFEALTASAALSRGGGPPLSGHTCGIATSSQVFCWGLNENGQVLGSNEFAIATPVQLPLDVTLTDISAGLANTCGVTSEADVVCWAYGTPWDRWFIPKEDGEGDGSQRPTPPT